MPTALVTGATAGLGSAFARHLAARGYDLTLVARSETALKERAEDLREQGVDVETIPADLTTDEGCGAVTECLRAAPAVDLLVNNAGIGYERPFLATGIAAEERLLDLNVRAVLRLTDAALTVMTERRAGAILNVASVAGLGPAWLSSTYPASKAWIIAFTESLASSHRVTSAGVRMTALLPGYTRTEFHQRAGIPTSFPPPWLWLSADDVVRTALEDLEKGRVVSIPSLRYKIAAWGLRHVPRSLARAVAWDISKPAH
ncbi:SDR family NAD(P)-dependent oxidoreductase [Streptomyces cacaoi]|uniref:Dehydrogenase n=1 Tax=Streptomyces cacaoi TaxID=1898 RepID=A0A4Y3R0M9_STRCI|nr:SDR family oxidoreductase [Streptomyces cacaoi]NNG88468.1 SDR family oxidoreductase [Streptomyces cacaoi]GEB51042.1 dehydrogenase [Streptomyces cacaoi]